MFTVQTHGGGDCVDIPCSLTLLNHVSPVSVIAVRVHICVLISMLMSVSTCMQMFYFCTDMLVCIPAYRCLCIKRPSLTLVQMDKKKKIRLQHTGSWAREQRHALEQNLTKLWHVGNTGWVSSRDRKRKREMGRRRQGGSKGVKLKEIEKEVTGGWREGQLAGRGRKRHLPFLSAEAGLWETVTSCCVVSLRGEGFVRSWYGVKEQTLFEG